MFDDSIVQDVDILNDNIKKGKIHHHVETLEEK